MATGHFQSCFPVTRPVSRPVCTSKVLTRRFSCHISFVEFVQFDEMDDQSNRHVFVAVRGEVGLKRIQEGKIAKMSMSNKCTLGVNIIIIKNEESTLLSDVGLVVELEHLKTKTRLIDEKFASVRGESQLFFY
jgi:hypothetical protein